MEPRSNLICKSFRKSEHKLEGNIHIISVNNVIVNERNTNLTSAIAQVGIEDKRKGQIIKPKSGYMDCHVNVQLMTILVFGDGEPLR